MEKHNAHENEKGGITPLTREYLSELVRDVIVIAPQTGSVFGGTVGNTPWGEKNNPWMQVGPVWYNKGMPDPFDENWILDFGGELTPALVVALEKVKASIIKGSAEERRWRISVPKNNAEKTKELLRENKVGFIKRLSPTRTA